MPDNIRIKDQRAYIRAMNYEDNRVCSCALQKGIQDLRDDWRALIASFNNDKDENHISQKELKNILTQVEGSVASVQKIIDKSRTRKSVSADRLIENFAKNQAAYIQATSNGIIQECMCKPR